MGCDIHFVVERCVTEWDEENDCETPVQPERWIGVYGTWQTPGLITGKDLIPKPDQKRDRLAWMERRPAFKDRNYDFFANLAGVRGEGPEPRGVPGNASELACWMIQKDGDDGHSHSWASLEEFTKTWLLSCGDETTASSVADQLKGGDGLVLYAAGLYDTDELKLYRVVYWFDN